MQNSPSEQPNLVKIIVLDNTESNFTVVIDSLDSNDDNNECFVKLYNETYQRLINGETTFEIEAGNDNIELSGNTKLLRNFGKLLRNSN